MNTFKRIAALVIAVLLIAGGFYVYHAITSFSGGISAAQAAQMFPAGPMPCPSDGNDLAAIEGWAPGAGQAERMSQNNQHTFGGFGSALAGSSETPTPQVMACRGMTAPVQAYFDRMDKRMALIPADGYDPNIRARELGSPDAIFAFVRDHIRTEGYAGEMRGPSGTLQSRGGSSVDKAYLLAGMLGAVGVPARLVHAPLSDAQATQLVDQIAASTPPPLPPSPQLPDAFKQLGIDEQIAQKEAADGVARIDAAFDNGIAAAQAPTQELAQTLGSGNAGLAKTDAAVRAQWNANVRDHWWVRVQQNGVWSDWDPSSPDAQPGTHLGGAPQGDELPMPSDDQQTLLKIRIVADYDGAASAQSTPPPIIEAGGKISALYGMPITIAIGDRSKGSQDLKSATSFTPGIVMGTDQTTGNAFQLDPPGGPRIAALHLQIETDIPGQAPHVVTRTILDRRNAQGAIDPSWTPERSAYAVTTTYDMLAVSGEFDPGFAAKREGDGLKALRAFVEYVSAGGYGKQLAPAGIAPIYPMEDLHYYEQDAIVRHRLETRGVHFFFDRPQIVMMHRALAQNGGKVYGIEQFDIVDNGMAATGSDPALAIRSNLTRGYLDTQLEQHLLAAKSDGGTIALFAAAKRSGVAQEVSTDPKYGGTAVVLSRPVDLAGRARIGWWQVDPSTGNLVGRMDDGAGQELVEYAIARANDWSTLYSMLQFYGDFFRCIAGEVEAPLEGMNEGQAQEWFKQCAGAALCSYLEALTMGEGFSRIDNDTLALIYNIMDLSIPGSKDSWPGTLGAACGDKFHSPLY